MPSFGGFGVSFKRSKISDGSMKNGIAFIRTIGTGVIGNGLKGPAGTEGASFIGVGVKLTKGIAGVMAGGLICSIRWG